MSWLRSLLRRDETPRRGRHARLDEAADTRLAALAEPMLKPLVPLPADPADVETFEAAKPAPGVEMGFGDGAVVPVTDERSVREFRQILERLFDQH